MEYDRRLVEKSTALVEQNRERERDKKKKTKTKKKKKRGETVGETPYI